MAVLRSALIAAAVLAIGLVPSAAQAACHWVYQADPSGNSGGSWVMVCDGTNPDTGGSGSHRPTGVQAGNTATQMPQTLRLRPGGRVVVRLRCLDAEARCTGTLLLSKGRERLGSAPYDVEPYDLEGREAGQGRARVVIARPGRKVLREARSRRPLVTVTLSNTDGESDDGTLRLRR